MVSLVAARYWPPARSASLFSTKNQLWKGNHEEKDPYCEVSVQSVINCLERDGPLY